MQGFELSGSLSGGPFQTVQKWAGQTAGHSPDTLSENYAKTNVSDCPVNCPELSGRYQMSAVCPVGVSLGHPTPDTRTTQQPRRMK